MNTFDQYKQNALKFICLIFNMLAIIFVNFKKIFFSLVFFYVVCSRILRNIYEK